MVQTVQGLNLESQFTTVEISLEGQNIGDITTILDKISTFHPLFIKEYTISPTLLTIRSKLPFLWRESANTFVNLSQSKITLEDAQQYVIEEVIGRRIKSMSTIPVLESAHNQNIETTPAVLDDLMIKDLKQGYRKIFNRYYLLGCGKGSQITGSIASSRDAYIAQNLQRDKWSTNTMIKRLNLPLPKWEVIDSIKHLEKVFPEYEKPVVIKPTGLTGGHGVVVGINTLEEATKAFKFAKEAGEGKATWQTKVMIQEQVKGEDYRILVINGKLEIATKRIPAFIIGNGKLNIKQLIEKENSDPRRDTTNPAHILKPIAIDEPLKDYIKEQGLTLNSVPEKGEKINVRKIASMSQGGITEDFTDMVSKEIKAIVESLAHSVHAFTLGVDVMCLDISKPLTKDNGAILEINTMPESYLNFYPILGKQREYVANTYIKELLKENICKKYVVIGQSKDDIPTLLRRKWIIKKEDTVGEVVQERYYINGMLMNEQEERWRAFESIKCNALLDVIVIHHRDWDDVKQYGLGFDHINTIFITKDMSTNKEYMKILKRYKRMKLIDNIKKI